MRANHRRTARRHLDAAFRELRPGMDDVMPPDGWIATIREALGMSVSDLARRLDMSPPAVRKLEASERAGTAQLATIERAAAAMSARLRYVVIPDRPLEQLVDERAREVARRELDAVNHTMQLEGQRPDASVDDEIVEARARELSESSRLWSSP